MLRKLRTASTRNKGLNWLGQSIAGLALVGCQVSRDELVVLRSKELVPEWAHGSGAAASFTRYGTSKQWVFLRERLDDLELGLFQTGNLLAVNAKFTLFREKSNRQTVAMLKDSKETPVGVSDIYFEGYYLSGSSRLQYRVFVLCTISG